MKTLRILVGVLSVLLVSALIMLYLQVQANKEIRSTITSIQAEIKRNNERVEQNKKAFEELDKQDKNVQVIVIKNNELYEKVKKSPINTKFTDAEYDAFLRKYGAK